MFEEDHPNTDYIQNVAIMHKGDDTKPFEKKGNIIGDVYAFHMIENS